jgi:diaminohydroxyphosphoribosylaminopyrimidine deaminase/5-amino-6-(5-phosphoribosylamino)uracil reductase
MCVHEDAHWMRRALGLARSYAGLTWPNPTVGACIVGRGRLLAEGAHAGAGHDHAEIVALKALGRSGVDPEELTLYVTLEPCHHEGRTPPCTPAIAAAGIGRVVYAIADTNPRVRGGGAAWLRRQGLRVESGLLSDAAWELNHPFFETRGAAEPHVTLKLALSMEGRLARRAGPVVDPAERRITGPLAHRRVHRLRAAARCILVGRGTMATDRPRLDVREVVSRGRPRPVVLDSRLSLDPSALPPATLVLTGAPGAAGRIRAFEAAGHEVTPVALERAGRLRWEAILDTLAGHELGVVLVEGGAQVAASLLQGGHAHRIHLFLAPRLLGGDGAALTAYAGMEQSHATLRAHRIGPDVEWILRRRDLPAPSV